jgi:hypothetical protein
MTMGQRFQHMDASESAFTNRALEQIERKLYEMKLPPLKWRDFVPVDNSIPNGVKVVTYRMITRTGAAKWITNRANDLPRAGLYTSEASATMRNMAASTASPRRAWRASSPLPRPRPTRCRTARPARRPGPRRRVVDTSEVESPDTLILPLSAKPQVQARMGDGSDTRILKHFLDNSDTIKQVMFSTKLETAGAGSTKRMVCYRRDPEVVRALINEWEQFPAQQNGLNIKIDTMARCGGVVARYPLAISYGDGI